MHNGQRAQAWERQQLKLLDITLNKLKLYNGAYKQVENIFDKHQHEQLQRALHSIRDQLAVAKSATDVVGLLHNDKTIAEQRQIEQDKKVSQLLDTSLAKYKEVQHQLDVKKKAMDKDAQQKVDAEKEATAQTG